MSSGYSQKPLEIIEVLSFARAATGFSRKFHSQAAQYSHRLGDKSENFFQTAGSSAAWHSSSLHQILLCL